MSPEVDISRVAAASAKSTLAAGPWEQQQVPGSLLCDILQEVTLVDLQLAVQCTLVSGGILVLSTAFTPAPACYHTMRGMVGTMWQGATERRVQIALKPSVPFPAVRADADQTLPLAALCTLRLKIEHQYFQLGVTTARG